MRSVLTTGWEDGIADLTERLVHELSAGKRVLWIVSGGSNIPASVDVMGSISSQLSKHLTVLLGDERYGEPGHADSNYEQLTNAGFEPEHATVPNILQAGKSLAETATYYEALFKEASAEADIVIGQLGMGDDGHIAGILPDSLAAEEDVQLVSGYTGTPFTRLTLTFPALKQIDAAYMFAFGNNKKYALQQLFRENLPLSLQPAQILKALPEAYVYNDQVGD